MMRIRKNLRLPDYNYSQPGYYFITVCTRERGKNILASIAPLGESVGGGLCAALPVSHPTQIGRIVEESIRGIPSRYTGTQIDIYCIMPDHVHFIISLEAGRDRARPLHEIIGAMKSYTDRQYRLLRSSSNAKLWQEGYYDHIIRNDEDLQNTRQYIQNNPLKWLLHQDQDNPTS